MIHETWMVSNSFVSFLWARSPSDDLSIKLAENTRSKVCMKAPVQSLICLRKSPFNLFGSYNYTWPFLCNRQHLHVLHDPPPPPPPPPPPIVNKLCYIAPLHYLNTCQCEIWKKSKTFLPSNKIHLECQPLCEICIVDLHKYPVHKAWLLL